LSSSAFLLVEAAGFFIVGLLAGWRLRLFFLLPAPAVVAWIWYRVHYIGEGDDITGPYAGLGFLLGVGAVILGGAVGGLARRAWRLPSN